MLHCHLCVVATISGSTGQEIGICKSYQTEGIDHKFDISHYNNNSILGGT